MKFILQKRNYVLILRELYNGKLELPIYSYQLIAAYTDFVVEINFFFKYTKGTGIV